LPGLCQVRKCPAFAIESNQIRVKVTKEKSLAVVGRMLQVSQIDRLGKRDGEGVEGLGRVGGDATTLSDVGVRWGPGCRGTAGQREQKDPAGSCA
jgi:hypothetical protein